VFCKYYEPPLLWGVLQKLSIFKNPNPLIEGPEERNSHESPPYFTPIFALNFGYKILSEFQPSSSTVYNIEFTVQNNLTQFYKGNIYHDFSPKLQRKAEDQNEGKK
jgi:hypothetical protein